MNIDNHQAKKQYILNADTGGSHIMIARFEVACWEMIAATPRRLELSGKASADSLLNIWCRCFEDLAGVKRLNTPGIAIAMLCPFDYRTGVNYINALNQN